VHNQKAWRDECVYSACYAGSGATVPGGRPTAQSPAAGAPAVPRSGTALILGRRNSATLSAVRDRAGTLPGGGFAASTGAGLKDLMARMGHDSERAAMIYLHETRGADLAITAAIDDHVKSTRERHDEGSA